MHLVHVDDRPTEAGPAAWFTGTVWLDQLAAPPRPSSLRVHRVTFQPGTRTAWHAHPVGQILHGVAGVGLVGSIAMETIRLRPGETVWIAPGERHWHGASPGQIFAHLAIQEADRSGQEAEWFEPVEERDYLAVVKE